MIRKILLCTDGSDYSGQALKYSIWLAEQSGASVTALYVSDLRRFEMPALMDLGGSLGIHPYQNLIAGLQEAEKEKAQLIEDFCQRAFAQAGLSQKFTFQTKTGLLVDTIEDFERGFDLIVLGKRGESADQAIGHLGSTLERVVRVSKQPCFITNRRFKAPRKIALAYDHGPSSQKIVDFILRQEWMTNYSLAILTVAEPEQETKAAENLVTAERRLKSGGFTVRGEMLTGVVEDALANYVEEAGIDLLLMGAYGHSRLRRLFIGSTTVETIRRCQIPILCHS